MEIKTEDDEHDNVSFLTKNDHWKSLANNIHSIT